MNHLTNVEQVRLELRNRSRMLKVSRASRLVCRVFHVVYEVDGFVCDGSFVRIFELFLLFDHRYCYGHGQGKSKNLAPPPLKF